MLAVEPGRLIRFEWRLGDEATTVTIRFFPRRDGTAVGVWHRGFPSLPYGFEDVWFLSLENLSRHLEGRDVVRCDFTTVTGDTICHSLEIAAPASAVWAGLVRPDQLERWIASRARVDLRAGGSWDLGWGAEGTLEVLSLEPERRLELAWDIGGRSVLTWELESSGGRTRLALVHSGFAPGTPVEGLQIGWLHFMLWLKSMVEVGVAWLPAVKEIAEPAAMLYAASQWAQMAELEGEEGVEGEVHKAAG